MLNEPSGYYRCQHELILMIVYRNLQVCPMKQVIQKHKEATKSRQDRDASDTRKVLANLATRSPFGPDKALQNMNGVEAESNENADNAKAKIIQSM